jgi:hypothetical protein
MIRVPQTPKELRHPSSHVPTLREKIEFWFGRTKFERGLNLVLYVVLALAMLSFAAFGCVFVCTY